MSHKSKVNYGGMLDRSRKKCMKCGGKTKMQGGGFPKQSDYPDYESWLQAVDEFTAAMGQQPDPPRINIPQPQPITQADFLPEGVTAPSTSTPDLRVIEPKRVDDIDAQANQMYNTGNKQYQQNYDRSLGLGVLNSGTPSERQSYRSFYRGKYGQGINPLDPFQLSLGIQSAKTGLGWLSGVMDRKRQNRYLGNNLSTLGRFESQPSFNFQPNAYNLYAKLGGNIKKYMFTNGAINPAFPVDKGKMQQGGSIVDYLNEQGANSSFQERKKLFSQLYQGERYRGTAKQNLKLLSNLRNPSPQHEQESTGLTREPLVRVNIPTIPVQQTQRRQSVRPTVTRPNTVRQPPPPPSQTVPVNDGTQRSVTPVFQTQADRIKYQENVRKMGYELAGYDADPGLSLVNRFSDEGGYCINNITGVMERCGIDYSNPQMGNRYIGNAKFIGNVQNNLEDFYATTSLQVGDQLIYSHDTNPDAHSKLIYDERINDEGKKIYKILTGSAKDDLHSEEISETELKEAMKGNKRYTRNYDKVNVYRPGLALDKEKLAEQRSNKDTKELIEFETSQSPNYTYSIRQDGKYADSAPEGLKKFIEFANNEENINQLVKNFGVSKADVHDELPNVIGELLTENKGRVAPVTGVGVGTAAENIFERVFKPKNQSIGPGQIRFNSLDESLKKMYNIKKPKDLFDLDKVIPLMAAMNIRNRQWMVNQGDKLSERLIGEPGVSAKDLKDGMGRWTPYIYNGLPVNPVKRLTKEAIKKQYEEANRPSIRSKVGDPRRPMVDDVDQDKVNEYVAENLRRIALLNEHGSYADKVFHRADEAIQRSSPTFSDEKSLQPVTVNSRAADVLIKASRAGNRDLVEKLYKTYPKLKENYPGFKKGGNWIPKNLKKGRCTPAPNPDCPVGSPQYNLAMTFKKHHGFNKKK